MPLLDHFHPPVLTYHHWESFHAIWAGAMMERLNQMLPSRYLAEIHVHLGNRVEADVAEFERDSPREEVVNGPGGGVAVAPWAPPVATQVLPAVFPDDIEVLVRDTRDDYRLVAVVELVSPGNKDRPESRQAFAAKVAAYLQRGVGLLVVDIVTSRQANMHNELVRLLGHDAAFLMAEEATLYAVAYRPVRRQEKNQIDVWPMAFAVGAPLPLAPLGLRGNGCVPVDLEVTYTLARQRSRL